MTLGGFLINRRNHRRYRLDGCRPSRIQPLVDAARPFLSLVTGEKLPNIVDLRPLLNPIDEQHMLGSCVGNALASMLEYFHFYTTGERKRFSSLFIYYNARLMEEQTSQRDATAFDSGADLQFAIVSLLNYGCCEERFWPFYQHLTNVQPHDVAYHHGQFYRVKDFSRLSNDPHQLRQCLAQGYPFVMAIKIFPSFALNHRGYIPMPHPHEQPSEFRHAVVCVGYIHSKRLFIIRNSHGIHWGDRGYGYLPYDYVADKILAKDLWAIKSVTSMIPISADKQIAWSDSPVLSRARSEADMMDDRSACDIVYPSGDDDEDDYRPRLHDRSPAPAFQEDDYPMQAPLMYSRSFAHPPVPMVYPQAPPMELYSYQPAMFPTSSYFAPF